MRPADADDVGEVQRGEHGAGLTGSSGPCPPCTTGPDFLQDTVGPAGGSRRGLREGFTTEVVLNGVDFSCVGACARAHVHRTSELQSIAICISSSNWCSDRERGVSSSPLTTEETDPQADGGDMCRSSVVSPGDPAPQPSGLAAIPGRFLFLP